MDTQLEIHFHNMDPSPAIRANVEEQVARLEKFADKIVSCRVTIDAPHKHQRKGRLYEVTVHMLIPGAELAYSRSPDRHEAHADVYVAIRDAFNAIERQLKNALAQQRGEVKTHEIPPHGIVQTLLPSEGYGFIRDTDGYEVYFHRNSVVNADFDDLAVGDMVRFETERGDEGLQATTVYRLAAH